MPDTNSDFSILLWALGAAVAGLALHLGAAWVRTAQRGEGVWSEWRALLMASGVIGLGLCAGVELCMQAQPLPFPVGYRWLAMALLMPVSVVACLPAAAVATAAAQGRYGSALLFTSGALLAAAAMGLNAGWIWAAGFRPGVVWRVELLGAAAVLLIVGQALALWLALSPAFQGSPRRTLWRGAAAALGALMLMLGLQLMMLAAGLQAQTLSSHKGELPGAVLSLVLGVLLPLALVTLMLDLWLRRHQHRRRRHGHGDFNPSPRRKRRHKVRAL